jgi:hypothetical protein
LGEWLPAFTFPHDFSNEALRIRQRDGFSYEGEVPSGDLLGLQGPADGTFLAYGDVGSPKGHVVYDYRHRIVFYEVGCCSWRDAVAACAGPPPKRVVDRDLSALRTVRGIRLGMLPADVEAIYGANILRADPKTPHVFVLAYTTWLKMPATIHAPCGQDEDFYFRDNRLVLIQLGNGC